MDKKAEIYSERISKIKIYRGYFVKIFFTKKILEFLNMY